MAAAGGTADGGGTAHRGGAATGGAQVQNGVPRVVAYPSTAKVRQTLNIGKSSRTPNHLIISAVHGQMPGHCLGVVCQTLPVLRYPRCAMCSCSRAFATFEPHGRSPAGRRGVVCSARHFQVRLRPWTCAGCTICSAAGLSTARPRACLQVHKLCAQEHTGQRIGRHRQQYKSAAQRL